MAQDRSTLDTPASTSFPANATAALLESWSGHEWENGVQVDELRDLERVRVRTRHSVYEIIVINGRRGEILLRGGQFSPDYVRGQLAGSSLGGSFLKHLGIYVGFRMEFHIGDRRIVTSRVEAVDVVPDHA